MGVSPSPAEGCAVTHVLGETKAQKQSAEEGGASSGSFGSDPLPPGSALSKTFLCLSLPQPERSGHQDCTGQTLCVSFTLSPAFRAAPVRSPSHQPTGCPVQFCLSPLCPTLHPMPIPASSAHPRLLCPPPHPLHNPTFSPNPAGILCLPLHPLFKRERLALNVGGSIQ